MTDRLTPYDMAVACGKRLTGTYAPMDRAWIDAVAERGIELAEHEPVLTIDMANGQRFVVAVVEVPQSSEGGN